ncbi:RNA polymerase II C-terminal domain phosphatase-like 3 [Oryza sativa Japonica Group]|uniref:protein-serine/threonine phosphatase n=4 Tax=Oryza sativa subsp. japonica TaxID=39947 RepID=Q2R3H8_ORYSJ|nr:RNA polymerase II C-terminal domain phosphatase-like 3 [Oryza sativa Japonica Group]ABA93957.1 NLI interacting factor-like phosphatase family protein, expressed [Oryza sativa Japonica Group]
MRVTVTPKDEERLVVLMARERPRSAVVAPGGDLVTAGGGGGGGGGGEGSDGDSSGSLEEISADDFKKESSAAGGAAAAAAAQQRSRVWMGYNIPRSYAPAFHSFAWAQAVQNKPLVPRAADAADEDEVEHVVDTSDEEKEEGEIEEGEAVQTTTTSSSSPPCAQPPETIDLDSDAPEKSESMVAMYGGGAAPAGAEEEEVDFDQRVGSILEELEMVSIEEAEKSFEGACTRLRTCFENLKPLFPESGSPMPMLDALVQQAFVGIDTITTVANSYDMPKREQTKNMLLKLLFHIKNRYSDMLTPDQRDELDSRVRQLVFEDGKDNANGPNATSTNAAAPSGQVLSERLPFESGAGNSFSKVEIPAKNRMVSPLLDLHADYDENSLPSPTRDSKPPFDVPKPIGYGALPMAPDRPSVLERVEPAKNSSYQSFNDALKAVCYYQQKHGQKSNFASDDLPSPTPSGDGDKSGDKGGDVFGEVSSFSASNKIALPIVNQMPSRPSTVSSNSDSFAGGPPGYAKQIENSVSGSNHLLKATAKSRDPRLKFLNRDTGGVADANRRVNFAEPNPSKDRTMGGGVSINSRKNKAVDEPMVDENALKRSRGVIGNLRDMQPTGRGGWAKDGGNISSYSSDGFQPNQNTRLGNNTTGNHNIRTDSTLASNLNNTTNNSGTSPGIVQAPQTNSAPQTSSAPAVSLPAMLKDIAVNPTMLMQWIQMEQQKMSASEPQQKVTASVGMTSNVTPGMVLPLGNAPKTTEVAAVPSVRPQVPMQSAPMHSQNDTGVIRMKPRDPRRILHSNIVQKNDTVPPVGVEQAKSNGTAPPDSQSSKDHLLNQDQKAEQLQAIALPSLPVTSSARPVTMNANPVSNSQLAATALMPPHGNTKQTSSSVNKADPRLAAGQNESNDDAATSTGPVTAPDAVPPASPYGDVDHLLDGYDDQQKALIQKERARRIKEQHKMFAARKLCLVLDLDHTLLNSAKFIEVDHIHGEILRKKEEQDRERAERHLFCFNHMGMWTKLRPGIWNFLEKASKLYELHLYTMGNKVYATEMAKVLDPTGTLFAGRVISRGDDGDPFDSDERVPKSKDLDGVLGMESAVVIIDDSVRVWPHNKHNLIVVERYTYFPCSRRQFGLPGPSLLEIDRDERPEDGTLASSLAVIERIHKNFFSHPNLNDADVRSILASEQQRILGGCRIVFSRIFPVGEANPHMHPLWQTAEQFGAVCTNQIDDRVTHVVANSLGTDKVNWALSTGRFVVHPGWVEASALLYRRASELDFAVK